MRTTILLLTLLAACSGVPAENDAQGSGGAAGEVGAAAGGSGAGGDIEAHGGAGAAAGVIGWAGSAGSSTGGSGQLGGTAGHSGGSEAGGAPGSGGSGTGGVIGAGGAPGLETYRVPAAQCEGKAGWTGYRIAPGTCVRITAAGASQCLYQGAQQNCPPGTTGCRKCWVTVYNPPNPRQWPDPLYDSEYRMLMVAAGFVGGGEPYGSMTAEGAALAADGSCPLVCPSP